MSNCGCGLPLSSLSGSKAEHYKVMIDNINIARRTLNSAFSARSKKALAETMRVVRNSLVSASDEAVWAGIKDNSNERKEIELLTKVCNLINPARYGAKNITEYNREYSREYQRALRKGEKYSRKAGSLGFSGWQEDKNRVKKAIGKFPPTFQFTHREGLYRISEQSSFMSSSGEIQLVVQVLRDGKWLDAFRDTPVTILRYVIM